jgi:hypothetical protein
VVIGRREFGLFGLPGFGCFTPTLERELPMTEMSPLRRRMIEDMTVRNLSPAVFQHSVMRRLLETQPG